MKLYTYHPQQGIVTVDTDKMQGRLHKKVTTRKHVKGKGWCTRHTLMRVGEKHLVKDKKGKVIHRRNNWGVAVKKEGRKWVAEYDMVAIDSNLVPALYL